MIAAQTETHALLVKVDVRTIAIARVIYYVEVRIAILRMDSVQVNKFFVLSYLVRLFAIRSKITLSRFFNFFQFRPQLLYDAIAQM